MIHLIRLLPMDRYLDKMLSILNSLATKLPNAWVLSFL